MSTMNRTTVTAAVLAATLGGTILAVAGGEQISDRELGLSKTSVFEVVDPPVDTPNDSEPGDRPTIPADFPEQPPLIPHGVGEFVPITLEENQCVECHLVEEKVEGEPTPVPSSHFVDLRRAPEDRQDELVGARYVCVSCHVSPGDAPPLVDNPYRTDR